MRPRIILHIFRKDLVETLRDRRTVVMAFVVPALIYPLLFTLLGSVATDKRGELERTVPRLGDARELFERLDPEGVFTNAHLERLGVRATR